MPGYFLTFPRRWGKSLNLSMLNYFLRIEVDAKGVPVPEEQRTFRKLFAGGEITNQDGTKTLLKPLNISNNKKCMSKFQGQYPVISLNLKDIKKISYESVIAGLQIEIRRTFSQYPYILNSQELFQQQIEDFNQFYDNEKLLKSNPDQLCQSLKILTEILSKHHKQNVIVLVDEYDSCINNLYSQNKHIDTGESDKIISVFRDLFGPVFKDNDYLKKGLLTGVFRIGKENLFSDLNNLSEYNLLHEKYNRYYGFTEQEVDAMMSDYQVPENLKQQIKTWYNGYSHSKKFQIYNPHSIIRCLQEFQFNQEENLATDKEIQSEKFLKSYWVNSGSIKNLSPMLRNPLIQSKIQILLSQRVIQFDLLEQITQENFQIINQVVNPSSNQKTIESFESVIFSYLFFGGYMTISENRYFRIPNQEIMIEFTNFLRKFYEKENQINQKYYQAITDSIINIIDISKRDQISQNIQLLKESIKNLLDQFGKFTSQDSNKLWNGEHYVQANENFLHFLISSAVSQIPNLYIQGYNAKVSSQNNTRPDILFVKSGLYYSGIIEIKYDSEKQKRIQSASMAIDQIKNNKYHEELLKKGDVVLIGIYADYNKTVQVEHEILHRNKSN